jgi:hypothetical protein
MRLRIFPLMIVCLLPFVVADGQVVDESSATVVIDKASATVELSIANRTGKADTELHLQLIDPTSEVRAEATQQLKIRSGRHRYRVILPLGNLVADHGDDIAWFRLRYRVGESAGILSLTELMKDVFELRVIAADRVVPGSEYRLRVRAVSPFTSSSVKKVAVEGTLKLTLDTEEDEDQIDLLARSTTNGDGLAILSFKVPPGITLDSEPEFEVTGRKNGVVRKVEDSLESDHDPTPVYFTTDKPMYQPGETFNLRGLFLDANNTVISGKEFDLTIKDEGDTSLFRATVTTSQYGVAAVSWKIPDGAKLGTYKVELDDDERLTFQVTRYDLPQFFVRSDADKTFYLTTDRSAKVTIGAEYIFGKPVTTGRVRVVRETERRWNWKEQKYEIDESDKGVEGATDPNGKYVATLDLSEAVAELNKSQWTRFEDLHFTAYFTDTSTNRTEQKRFDIRISKEPIHVYFIYYDNQHPELPMLAYVSTFYADGAPAECSVDIRVKGRTVDSLRTNSYGAARIKFPIPEDVASSRKLNLRVTARDRRGQRGTFDESLSLNEKTDAIQLEADKAVYTAGEAINLRIASTEERGLVYVDLVKDHVVIESLHVDLKTGKASLRIPYRDLFKGEITISAYTDQPGSYAEPEARFSRGVIFPERRDLRLDVKFNRKSYRPGDDGNVRFSVFNAGGTAAETALGITLFDKAIEERAKTEGKFDGYFGAFAQLLGLDRTFGSISLKDLNEVDASRPVSDEMQLAAEVILAGSHAGPKIFRDEFDADDVHTVYSEFLRKQVPPMEKILRDAFAKDQSYPQDADSLANTLLAGGMESQSLHDPWGKNYTPSFFVDRSHLVLRIGSSGPDRRAGSPDDFYILTLRLPYFAKTAGAIDTAVTREYLSTGRHIRDAAALEEVMRKEGIDPELLLDPWKRPYRVTFGVTGRNYVIHISSLGPDGIQAPVRSGGDDFDVANIYSDYFYRTESQINTILRRAFLNSGRKKFPDSVDQFKAVVRSGGVELESLRDGHGSPLYVVLDKPAADGSGAPVFSIRGAGIDKADPADDLSLGQFSRDITERYSEAGSGGTAEIRTVEGINARGAIRGTVVDQMDAVIAGAEIIAAEEGDKETRFVTSTDGQGRFLLTNVPSGRYSVSVVSPGFSTYRQDAVAVRSQTVLEIRVMLMAAGINESVTVTSGDYDVLNTSSATVGTTKRGNSNIVFPYSGQTVTPRLREYFPETLVWQPELISDRRGRAELNFKVADNITTWKMYAIASAKNGKIGMAEKEITSFQPFFVDIDPPKFLTEGDQIGLPVQVRNYTEEKQAVDVSLAKAGWYSLTGVERQAIEVEPGRSTNAIFRFRADFVIKDGKQRVTATANNATDAIERSVTVRPNGQEVVQTQSKLFTGAETFRLDFPANALPGTPRAEVKIYPNLFSHVGESVEGLLKRPYGCGEQTISSTYPNVMVLKFVKADTPLRRKALEYLQKGYERLVGYQVADGGFSYWGGEDPSNIALTAYALRFLTDASEFVDVDDDIIRRAEGYLAVKQNADGSWPGSYTHGENETNRNAIITAYVARSMAMRKPAEKTAALQKALDYVDARRSEIQVPHTLALFGLALLDSGDTAKAKSVAELLQTSGTTDGSGVYWDISSSTPFNGRGKPGRIETTALVTQLRSRTLGIESASAGLIYLLSNKDQYGVWYSTQTTVNVLDALLAAGSLKADAARQSVRITLGGAVAENLTLDPTNILPVKFDLQGNLVAGSNLVEVRSGNGAPLMVSTVATHYIAWQDVPTNTHRDLTLDYRCDKTEAAIASDVTCTVAGGGTSPGQGMLLAEIGLPPGAEVDRGSLDRTLQRDSGVNRYEILPDRIVVYFWARPNGTKFSFTFRPRYGIEAQTPASVVYDYYNPETRATVPPLRFSIR